MSATAASTSSTARTSPLWTSAARPSASWRRYSSGRIRRALYTTEAEVTAPRSGERLERLGDRAVVPFSPAQELLGIGVDRRSLAKLGNGHLLDDAPCVHHAQAVAEMGDDGEVVADQD